MALEPRKLNESNRGYGSKDGLQHAWRAGLQLLDGLKEKYENGAYGTVVQDGLALLKSNGIKSINDIERMDEFGLALLYWVGMAYRKQNSNRLAVAALQVVYSQLGFTKYMLSPFPEYVALASKELEGIAAEEGEEFVNSSDIAGFFEENVKKAGSNCFIATAACGDPYAPEILVLSNFRDHVLIFTRIGRGFIAAYSVISPPIASVISRFGFLRRTTMNMVVRPLVFAVRKMYCPVVVKEDPAGNYRKGGYLP